MAVEDKFVNSDLQTAGKKANRALVSGAPLLCLAGNFEIAAADDNASVYRLGRLPANAIPVDFKLYSDGITGGTDYDLGLYKPGVGGAVVDKDIFLDGWDASSAAAITAPKDARTNLGGADPLAAIGKKLWDLLGLTAATARQDYDVAITANTVGTGAGTIAYELWYMEG